VTAAPGRMTRRADYLAANRGQRQTTPGFILLVRDRRDGDPSARLGITVSKKVGGAVVRNRMKRRFRALARALLADHAVAGADHVLIGRREGIERDFSALREEFVSALARVAKKVRGQNPSPVRAERSRSPSTETRVSVELSEGDGQSRSARQEASTSLSPNGRG